MLPQIYVAIGYFLSSEVSGSDLYLRVSVRLRPTFSDETPGPRPEAATLPHVAPQTSPRSSATRMARARESTPSLVKTLTRWLFTVASVTNSSWAIWAFEAPVARSLTTSRSRRVSFGPGLRMAAMAFDEISGGR